MEVNTEKVSNGGEIGLSEKATAANVGEVVVVISGDNNPNSKTEVKDPKVSSSIPVSCPSPEIGGFSPSPNKPPKIPITNEAILTRRKTLARSVYSKPKSRFGEQTVTDSSMFEESNNGNFPLQGQSGPNSPYRNSFNRGSPSNKSTIRTVSITPKTPRMASPGGPGVDEDEEIYKKVNMESQQKHKRVKTKVLVEFIAFVILVCCLVASLTVHKLEKVMLWELEIWKWCVLVLVTFSGLLITRWCMNVIVFLIEKNFLLKRKVLYFVYGMRKSVRVFIWLGLILLTWELLINHGVKRSELGTKILSFVTWTMVSLLIVAFLWLLKTLLLKILASSFHVNTFFDRIHESIFHQYILQTLSGPPLIEEAERIGRSPSFGQFSFRSTKLGKGKKEKKEVIDVWQLQKMKRGKISAWTMKTLVDAVTTSGLSTISNTLEHFGEGGGERGDIITNEMEAIAAAYHIFRNVAQPGCKYIEEEDLLRFMIKEEVDIVFQLFEGAETGRIDRKALTNWVVKVYKGRQALGHALNDTKTAVKQLNKLVTGVLVIVAIVIWLLLTEIATTKVLVLLSSQLVVAAFMFGNTCKTIFEAIIFVFVMHPFDVGDRCVVDGVQLMVEEMNILTTVFLKLDNEKVYYPNSVLATKAISNYYRSPDMGDTIEFSIDFMTPAVKIGLLKEKIKMYLEKNPQHWHPNHLVTVKEIENVNKLKMGFYPNHTMNFQEFGEKNKRRTELVLELKRIFEEIGIRYYLLPQAVHLRHSTEEVSVDKI